MSKLKHIEHDGFEEFKGTEKINRKKAKALVAEVERISEANRDADLAKRQAEYLSHNNPALWEGDSDD